MADASDDQDWSERFSELLNTIMPTGTGRPDAEPQSHQVIALTASGQLGMAAAAQIQIQLAVVSLVRRDRARRVPVVACHVQEAR